MEQFTLYEAYHKHIGRRWGILVVAFFLNVGMAHAASISIALSVTEALLDNDGQPLADGSLVYVILSEDGVPGPMDGEGTGGPLVGDSVSGGDKIVAELRVDSQSGSLPAGTIPLTFISDAWNTGIDSFTNLYLRFFDWQGAAPPVGTEIWWGVTDMYELDREPLFEIDFITIIDSFQVSDQDDFTVIPEPGTLHLLLLAGGALMGWRRHTVKRRQRGPPRINSGAPP